MTDDDSADEPTSIVALDDIDEDESNREGPVFHRPQLTPEAMDLLRSRRAALDKLGAEMTQLHRFADPATRECYDHAAAQQYGRLAAERAALLDETRALSRTGKMPVPLVEIYPAKPRPWSRWLVTGPLVEDIEARRREQAKARRQVDRETEKVSDDGDDDNEASDEAERLRIAGIWQDWQAHRDKHGAKQMLKPAVERKVCMTWRAFYSLAYLKEATEKKLGTGITKLNAKRKYSKIARAKELGEKRAWATVKSTIKARNMSARMSPERTQLTREIVTATAEAKRLAVEAAAARKEWKPHEAAASAEFTTAVRDALIAQAPVNDWCRMLRDESLLLAGADLAQALGLERLDADALASWAAVEVDFQRVWAEAASLGTELLHEWFTNSVSDYPRARAPMMRERAAERDKIVVLTHIIADNEICAVLNAREDGRRWLRCATFWRAHRDALLAQGLRGGSIARAVYAIVGSARRPEPGSRCDMTVAALMDTKCRRVWAAGTSIDTEGTYKKTRARAELAWHAAAIQDRLALTRAAKMAVERGVAPMIAALEMAAALMRAAEIDAKRGKSAVVWRRSGRAA